MLVLHPALHGIAVRLWSARWRARWPRTRPPGQ